MENVLQKASSVSESAITAAKEALTVKTDMEHWKDELKPEETTEADPEAPAAETTEPEQEAASVEAPAMEETPAQPKSSVLDDWIKDMEELEREMEKQKQEEQPTNNNQQ